MGRRIRIEPVKKVYNDELVVEVLGDSVTFHAHIDGAGNMFRISKAQFKEFLWRDNGIVEKQNG